MVPHFFIASHHLTEEINAAWYEQYAINLLEEQFKKHDIIVVTGGTGLYIKALTEGLDNVPAIANDIRDEIISNYNKLGIEWLKEQLILQDHLFAEKGEMQNPQRMIRALEVVRTTGNSILSYHNKEKTPRNFNIFQIGLEKPRDFLYQNINKRVDEMIQGGLVDEVTNLIPFKGFNALQTVGYKELFEYFDGRIGLEKAIEFIKQHTRQYAKRQMTWFKKQTGFTWIDLQKTNTIVPAVAAMIEK